MVENAVNVDKEAVAKTVFSFEECEVIHRAGGKIVDDIYFISSFQIGFSQMRTDKAGPTGDKNTHTYSFMNIKLN